MIIILANYIDKSVLDLFKHFYKGFFSKICKSIANFRLEFSDILDLLYNFSEISSTGSNQMIEKATKMDLPTPSICLKVCGLNIFLQYLEPCNDS